MLHQTLENGVINNSVFGTGNKMTTRSATITGTLTLTAADANEIFVDATATDRTILLPAEADGLHFTIHNVSASAALAVKEDSNTTTIVTLAAGESATVVSNGTTWYAEGGSTAQNASGIVSTTATVLALTRALHSGKIVRVASTVPIAITLPAAAGTGARYRLFVAVAATATPHTVKVANTADAYSGVVAVSTTVSDNMKAFKAAAADDTISLNGTTTGGVLGDTWQFDDIAVGVWAVLGVARQTTVEATPFSASV